MILSWIKSTKTSENEADDIAKEIKVFVNKCSKRMLTINFIG